MTRQVNINYQQQLAGIDNLADRRTILCKKYMKKMKRTNHPLHVLLPKSADKNCIYELRDKTEEVSLYQDFKFCRTKKTENFFYLQILLTLLTLLIHFKHKFRLYIL